MLRSFEVRRPGLLLVLHLLLALLAAGCSSLPQPSLSPTPGQPSARETQPPVGTSDITAVALEIATGDERLADFLRDHPFEVADITVRSGDVVDVFVRFDDPVPLSEWPPLDVCAISESERPATGIHWRVTLSSERPPAVSPMWGDVSCIPY